MNRTDQLLLETALERVFSGPQHDEALALADALDDLGCHGLLLERQMSDDPRLPLSLRNSRGI